ncbi:MAG: WecB/TagA/CpsF family glycosyltransferase [Flavobacterium sp.]
MKYERISLLGTYVDNLSMNETIEIIENAIRENKQIHQADVNAGKIVAMQTDEALRISVNEADIINADGQPVLWTARLFNKPLKERVSGVDLFTRLIEKAHQKNYKIFLLGAKQEVVELVNQRISKEYSPDIVAGFANGYFNENQENEIINQIISCKPQMLFVAMTSPYKEIFLHKYKNDLKDVNFIMGVGGSFDVYSGKIKRAPLWMQKSGLEWFFRFTQDPLRMWKRYLIGNTKFILLVLKEKFTTK